MPMQVPMLMVRAFIIGVGVILGGCSAPPRLPAVPMELEDRAVVLGNPALRTWADEVNPEFRAELIEAARRMGERTGATPGSGAANPTYFLALSGGGADGAFGAGLLCGWTIEGSRPEFTVVTGISTGALIAPFAFLGPEYDEPLRFFYTTVRTREIATSRFILRALAGDAIMDTAPLRRLMSEVVDEDMMAAIAAENAKGRILVVGTTNIDADRAVIWNIGAIAASGHPDALQLIRDVLIASAAIPAAFPPVMIDVKVDEEPFQEMHLDGATRAQVFLYPPSLELRAEAAARGVERERVAYVILNTRLERQWASVPRRTIPIARRAIGSLINANAIGDLFRIYLTARRDNVAFNLAYIPSTFDAEAVEGFDPEYMTALFDLGFKLGSLPGGYPWATSPPGWTETTEPDPVDASTLSGDQTP